MENRVATTDYSTPEPVGASFKDISNLASEVAEIFKYKIGEDIKQIVANLGGKIVYKEYDDIFRDDDGTIFVHGPHNFEIHLPNFTGPLRDRFTIAHEIGHYLLHSRFGKKKIKVSRFSSDSTTDRIEWEANWFAAGFLMPEKEFEKDYQEPLSLEMIAAKYLVSVDAVRVRAKQLELKR